MNPVVSEGHSPEHGAPDAWQRSVALQQPQYDDAAERYNQAVATYNATCAGHSYDEVVLRQAKATLACPRFDVKP